MQLLASPEVQVSISSLPNYFTLSIFFLLITGKVKHSQEKKTWLSKKTKISFKFSVTYTFTSLNAFPMMQQELQILFSTTSLIGGLQLSRDHPACYKKQWLLSTHSRLEQEVINFQLPWICLLGSQQWREQLDKSLNSSIKIVKRSLRLWWRKFIYPLQQLMKTIWQF